MVRRGVPDGCLPRVRGQRTEDELVSMIFGILDGMPAGRARELAIVVAVCGPPASKAGLAALARRFGIARSTAYDVMDMSGGRTNVMDMQWIAPSGHRTPGPVIGQTRNGSTSGLGASITPGVENSVDPEAPPSRGLSISRCEWCGDEITGRRAKAKYCGVSHQQKAHRAREKARRAGRVTPGGGQ